MADLACLLGRPGEEIPAVELVALLAPDGTSVERSDGGVEMLDERARQEYAQRIAELNETLEDAEARADLGTAERARAELDAVEAALEAAVGLGGRPRRSGERAERARKSVYNRIRAAIRRIDRELPALARHLEASVRTGRSCCYAPEREVDWTL